MQYKKKKSFTSHLFNKTVPNYILHFITFIIRLSSFSLTPLRRHCALAFKLQTRTPLTCTPTHTHAILLILIFSRMFNTAYANTSHSLHSTFVFHSILAPFVFKFSLFITHHNTLYGTPRNTHKTFTTHTTLIILAHSHSTLS